MNTLYFLFSIFNRKVSYISTIFVKENYNSNYPKSLRIQEVPGRRVYIRVHRCMCGCVCVRPSVASAVYASLWRVDVRARMCAERGGVLTAHSTREVTASPLPSARTYILHRRRFSRRLPRCGACA